MSSDVVNNAQVSEILKSWPGAEVKVDCLITAEPEILAASRAAGAYLDKLGKTNLARLTPGEWFAFLRVAIAVYRRAAALERPY